jgi:hypothetical protein
MNAKDWSRKNGNLKKKKSRRKNDRYIAPHPAKECGRFTSLESNLMGGVKMPHLISSTGARAN